MAGAPSRRRRLPPGWFIRTAWRVHRGLYRARGDRALWTTESKRGWGALRLTARGRRTGQERSVIVGYLEDGPNLVTMAMNGWQEGHPSWWLNLQADPAAVVKLAGREPSTVRAREATGAERERLWRRWAEVDEGLDDYAARRRIRTPVVVLEPDPQPRLP